MNKVVANVIAGLLLGAPLVATPLVVDDDDRVVTTDLSRVRRSPEAFKGVTVRFNVQYAWMGRLQNPFFTRFDSTRFANVQVWADRQEIWEREKYDDIFGLLFLSKHNAQMNDLFNMQTYQRLAVTGVVRNVFQGDPWIEIVRFEPIDRGLDTATLAHLYRGHKHMQARKWKQAISELSLAPVSSTPEWVQSSVHRDLGRCYLRLGESKLAQHHLTAAMNILGDSADFATRRLAHTAATNPESELDRSINRHSLKDHERPIWEAFEEAAESPLNQQGAPKPPK